MRHPMRVVPARSSNGSPPKHGAVSPGSSIRADVARGTAGDDDNDHVGLEPEQSDRGGDADRERERIESAEAPRGSASRPEHVPGEEQPRD